MILDETRRPKEPFVKPTLLLRLAAPLAFVTLSSGCDALNTCEQDGAVYELGESFDAGDGCNSCSCTKDGTVCTNLDCGGCVDAEGLPRAVGETWESECNTCVCMEDHGVDCTDLDCLDSGE